MYVVTPWPNVLYAFDLTREGYPSVEIPAGREPNAIGIACCDTSTAAPSTRRQDHLQPARRPHRGRRRRDGTRALEDTIADVGGGETTPMAPLVVEGPRDRRRLGRRVRYLRLGQGLDLDTGKIVWTARNIGPMRTCWCIPACSNRSTTRAPISGKQLAEDAWKPAALRCGAGSRTTRSSIWSTTVPAIPRPTTPSSAR